MKDDASNNIYDVAVLRKALDILEAISLASPLGVTELSARTGVSKASAFRVLSTLERRDYVEKDPESRKYRPGTALIMLGGRIVSNLDLVRQARAKLEDLQAEYGETVNLGIRSGANIVYVDMIESNQGLRTAAQVGSRDPLYSTALGKAVLAALSDEDARELFDAQPRVQSTPNTITDWRRFDEELAAIRERGYAIDDEENEIGSRCVAVAIRDRSRRPIAALSVSGPVSRMGLDSVDEIGRRVRASVDEIEQQMGYATRV